MTLSQTIAQTSGLGQSDEYALDSWIAPLWERFVGWNQIEECFRRAAIHWTPSFSGGTMSYAEQTKDIQTMYQAAVYRLVGRGDMILAEFQTEAERKERRQMTPAELWVEAEHNIAVRNVVIDWYKALKADTAENRYPDPESSMTQDYADWVLGELDADLGTAQDLRRTNSDAGVEFVARLSPPQRIAMADDVLRAAGTWQGIQEEAEERLAWGEDIPPGAKKRAEEPAVGFGDE